MRARQFFPFRGGAMLSEDSRFLKDHGIHCYMTGWRYLIRTRPWIHYDTKGRPWSEIKEILEADGFTEVPTPRFIYQNSFDGPVTILRDRAEEIGKYLQAYKELLAKTAPEALSAVPEDAPSYDHTLGAMLDEHIESLADGGDLHTSDI